MSRVRSVLPTDLIALLSSARAGRNEAWPRERVHKDGASLNLVGRMFDQLLVSQRGRGAWIAAERQSLHGLAGARRRGGRRAWEIDYLTDASPDQDVALALLERVMAATGRSGGEKVFLRLHAGSPLIQSARAAGFLPYQEEVLYVRPGGVPIARPSVNLRTASPADSYRIFRLYCENTPESVRRLEAASFAEWQAAQEQVWLRQGTTLVEEGTAELESAVSAAFLGNDLCLGWLGAGAQGADVQGTIAAVSNALAVRPGRIQVLLPAGATGLTRAVEASGFEKQRSFTGLVCRTTRPVALRKKQPAVARSVVEA